MEYRSFGKTDLKVSEIGFGCQSLGGGLYYRDDSESIMTLKQAFDSGINFYDTSDHYSQGISERLIGRAFKDRRNRVILSSKAGTLYSSIGSLTLRMRPLLRPMSYLLRPMKISLHLMRASQKSSDFSAEYLTKAVHESLRRLQTDYLDLFQLHKPPSSILERGDFCETLEKLKDQGKIRYYGVSCARMDDSLICLKHSGISSIQVGISLLDQEAITKLLPVSQEKKLAIIARNPRAQGHLTNNLSDITAETYAKNQREYEDRKNRARKFQFLIKKNRTLAQAALQFVLQLDGVSVVIPRAINREQLEENLGALTAPPLTKEELERIFSIY
jgi:aryl-alcohol dehydrogenase-like predicted oxidoreductase